LNIGGTTVQAAYASGTGTTALTFTYTILSGQTDANGISIDANSLNLNSGTISDSASNNAALTHTAVSDNASYMVDTTAPTTTVSTVAFSADTGTSSSDFITATAAQDISGTLSANIASGETVYVSLDNGSTWTAATTTVGQNTYSLTQQTLTSSNTLKVKLTDAAGNSGTALSQAYVLDAAAPTVSSVAITSATGVQNSTLNAGDVVTATATFSEAVTVDTSGGTPYLNLNIGGTTVQAAYASGTGTTALTFSYTILSGQNDANGIRIDANSLNLNSGTIQDDSGNNAALTHTAVTDNASYMVDAIAPTVSSVAITGATGAQSSYLNTGDVVTATVTFSEAVTVVTSGGTPYLNLNIGGTTVQAAYASGTGTTALTFSYTILSGQNDANGISIDANSLNLNSGTISDAAGNNAALTHTAVTDNASYMVDAIAPTVSSVAITSAIDAQNNYLNAGDEVTATVTFSEAVTVVTTGGTPYLNLNIGGTTVQAAYASGSGTTALTFTYTILSGQNDANGISIDANSLNLNSGTIQDDSGNNVALTHTAVTDNASYMVDTSAPAAPSVALTSDTGDSSSDNITSNSSVTVSGVETGATWEYSTDSGATWSAAQAAATTTFTLSDGTYASGEIQVLQTDQAGNLSATTGSNSSSWTVDSIAPTAQQRGHHGSHRCAKQRLSEHWRCGDGHGDLQRSGDGSHLGRNALPQLEHWRHHGASCLCQRHRHDGADLQLHHPVRPKRCQRHQH
jgi:hypothetical protein